MATPLPLVKGWVAAAELIKSFFLFMAMENW